MRILYRTAVPSYALYRHRLPLRPLHLLRSTPMASPPLRLSSCPMAMPTRTEQNPTLQSRIPSHSATLPTPPSEVASPEMPSVSGLNELVESGMLLSSSSSGEGGGSPPLDVELLARQLRSDPHRGLSTTQRDDMEWRARQFGSNRVPPSRQVTFLELIVDALKVSLARHSRRPGLLARHSLGARSVPSKGPQAGRRGTLLGGAPLPCPPPSLSRTMYAPSLL